MNKLEEFSRWVLQQTFEGNDIAGDSAQEKAYELGVVTKESFDPEVHCEIENKEILNHGDDIYLFSEELTSNEQEIKELKAQVELLKKKGSLLYVNLSYSTDPFADQYRSIWKRSINKTPEQCLGDIEAKAIHAAADDLYESTLGDSEVVDHLKSYANDLTGE